MSDMKRAFPSELQESFAAAHPFGLTDDPVIFSINVDWR